MPAVDHLARNVLAVPQAAASRLLMGQAGRLLATTTLATFPNSTMGEDGEVDADIAARWGFGHPGRFAALYRETYGCGPGATLRA
ncbi:hypothetical protein [Nonomuraea sp. NPDC050643]|uniref:hypothetical protein n=1 Tax=Nonomuraea sp. NPDC050643 TaxID=3155660 RepID=UPI0033C3AF71